jgi:hypothetical protein
MAEKWWREFRAGELVFIYKPISDMEKHLFPRRTAYEFIEYSNPHGYAKARDWSENEHGGGGTWWLHPEALVLYSGLCPVCGENVCIKDVAKDRRLIGSCMDAFTLEQWVKE